MQTALAVLLVLVVPVWDAWYTRRLKRSLHPRRKVRAYLTTGAWLWTASVWVWAMQRPGFLYPLRWTPHRSGGFGPAFALGVSVAFIASASVQVVLARRSRKTREAVVRAMQKLSFILPSTRQERWLFAALSITAGICEETLYRGFLMQYFGAHWHLGLVAAIAISSCVFGIAHEYQGIQGIVATGIIGAVLALLYTATGSLAVAMAVHAAVDLRVLALPTSMPAEPAR